MIESMPKILLVDNGSVKPAATLMLRKLAQQLSESSGYSIDPVSLRHANKVDASLLEQQPAQIFMPYLQSELESGQRNFIVLPLFFGLSDAVTQMIPQQQSSLEDKYGPFNLMVARELCSLPDGANMLTNILHDHITQTVQRNKFKLKNIVLVDHGSPSRQVTEVRLLLARELKTQLGLGMELSEAVMDRREGREYDFNGPLLEHRLEDLAASGEKTVLVSQMFLLPGRHAGENGDISKICNRVMQRHSGFKVLVTPLVAQHPDLIKLLQRRLQEVIEQMSKKSKE